MKNVIALTVLGILGLVVYFLFGYEQKDVFDSVTIRGRVFAVEIMDSDEERAQGLSGRTALGQDEGMLFLMRYKSRPVFWMKEMNFPLDIVWIDGDKIVAISENVPVPTSPNEIARVQPDSPVDIVLEINAGEASKSGIVVGDVVEFQGITSR